MVDPLAIDLLPYSGVPFASSGHEAVWEVSGMATSSVLDRFKPSWVSPRHVCVASVAVFVLTFRLSPSQDEPKAEVPAHGLVTLSPSLRVGVAGPNKSVQGRAADPSEA